MKRFLLWAVLCVLTENIWSQSAVRISGTVSDASDGSPVSYADVWLEGTPIATMTDENGRFQFVRVAEGFYELRVARVGYFPYRERIHVTETSPLILNIRLKPDVYQTGVVIVTGKRENWQLRKGEERLVLNMDSFTVSIRALEKLLREVPGLTLIRNENGTIKLLPQGSISDFVKVLVDGVDLTDPQTGEVNLSHLSSEMIDHIEVKLGGGSSRYGSGAGGVVIEIHTKKSIPHRWQGSVTGGSFLYRGYSQTIGLNAGEKRSLVANFAYQSARNDFPYQKDGETLSRKNNNFITRSITLSENNLLNFLNRDWLQLAGMLQWQSRTQKLPGSIYQSYRPRSAEAREEIFSGSYQIGLLLREAMQWNTVIAYRRDKAVYDGSEEAAFRFRTDNQNQRLEVNSEFSYEWQSRVSASIGGNYIHEKGSIDDLLNRLNPTSRFSRDLFSGYVQLYGTITGLPGILSYHLSVRRNSRYQTESWFPGVEVAITRTFGNVLLRSGGSYSENFKLPDLNSLYWISSATARGNPHLQPETGISRKVYLLVENRYFLPLEVRVERFANEINRYILWQPDFRGVWSPSNQGRMSISGWNWHVQTAIHHFLKGSYDYYHQNPRNHTPGPNSDGKTIPFLYFYQHKWTLKTEKRPVSLLLEYQKNSSRETLISNTAGTRLPPFQVLDAQLTVHHSRAGMDWVLSLDFMNVLGEDYQLILGYPLPERRLLVTLQLKW